MVGRQGRDDSVVIDIYMYVAVPSISALAQQRVSGCRETKKTRGRSTCKQTRRRRRRGGEAGGGGEDGENGDKKGGVGGDGRPPHDPFSPGLYVFASLFPKGVSHSFCIKKFYMLPTLQTPLLYPSSFFFYKKTEIQ